MSDKPTLILFCGLPGSGKTTLGKELEKQGKGIRICTDDWQESLGVSHDDDLFHERLQRRLYEHALELLQNGQDVILEDGLWQKFERSEKLADAQKHGIQTEMHFFDLTFDEIWRRLDQRNKNPVHGAVLITRDKLEEYWAVFQRPDEVELTRFTRAFIHKA